MKYFPSLFIGVVFLALLQTETVIAAARSRQVPILSKGLRLYGDSRGAGDIEIGPDPTFVCPPNTPVAPHPERCELYYTCYPGYPVTLWQCYSDYLFDLKYSGCNFPMEVDCGTRKRPAASAQTTTPPTTTPPCNTVPSNQPTFHCPTPDGFFAIPNTCTGDYYVCVSGSPYVSTCPNGTVFDPATRICTSPANASCTKPVFTCPTPDGFFPIPGACNSSYYACVGNVPYVQTCPGTTIFDPITRKCVPAANATCTAATSTTVMPAATTPTTSPTTTRPTTTTTTSTTTTPTTKTTPSTTTTPTTTTSTTTTPVTTTRTTTTPTTTTPTTTTPTTTTPTTTTPTTTTPTTTTPTTTTPTTTTPTTTTPTTTTPTTTTPTTTTPTTTTPTTTTPTTTTPTTTTPTTTTPTTTTPTTTTPTTTTPTTTTSTTTKPTTTSTTIRTTVGPFTCPTSHGYFPVPGVSCSTQYYMCSNYYAYLMDCAAPTVYNPALQTCDWSYNVAGCQTMRMAFKSWKRDI